MSRRATDEWRCPYCDGLNDWQDEICQICGDGRREEAGTASAKADPTYTDTSYTETPNLHMRSAGEELEEPESSFTYTSTSSSYTEPSGTSAYEKEAFRTASAAAESTREPSKTCEEPKKKKSSWKILVILIFVAFAGTLWYMDNKSEAQEESQRADNKAAVEAQIVKMSTTDPAALADQIDLSLFKNIPGTASQAEVHAWLEQQGCTVEAMEEPNEYYYQIKCREKETDWTHTLPFSEYSKQQLVCSLPCAGYDMNQVYDCVSKRLTDNGWTRICEGGSASGEHCKERLSVWKDETGIFYYLWTYGEERNPEIWGEELSGCGVEFAREEEDADADKSQFASYDIQTEISDFQSFLEMPFPENMTPEQWVEAYGAGYPNGFEISGYEKDGVNKISSVRKTYFNVANLEEILPYLKDGFEEASGQNMEGAVGSRGSYSYSLRTEKVSIYLNIFENRSFNISVYPA